MIKTLSIEQSPNDRVTINNDRKNSLSIIFNVDTPDADFYSIHFDELQSILKKWQSDFMGSLTFETKEVLSHPENI